MGQRSPNLRFHTPSEIGEGNRCSHSTRLLARTGVVRDAVMGLRADDCGSHEMPYRRLRIGHRSLTLSPSIHSTPANQTRSGSHRAQVEIEGQRSAASNPPSSPRTTRTEERGTQPCTARSPLDSHRIPASFSGTGRLRGVIPRTGEIRLTEHVSTQSSGTIIVPFMIHQYIIAESFTFDDGGRMVHSYFLSHTLRPTHSVAFFPGHCMRLRIVCIVSFHSPSFRTNPSGTRLRVWSLLVKGLIFQCHIQTFVRSLYLALINNTTRPTLSDGS